jgi:HTH-type transcriptional regulator/antitoxin HigA
MSTAHIDFDNVIAALSELHAVLERLRGEFVHGIKTPADYRRATALLDELTDGRKLSPVEENVLIELESVILAYQRDSLEFREFNATFEASCTPVQLIRDLMETLGLTGSELPEIGDKTAVSKVLSGSRPISHKMAYALADRFAMEPAAFLSPANPALLDRTAAANLNPGASYHVSREHTPSALAVKESGGDGYAKSASKRLIKTAKGMAKK